MTILIFLAFYLVELPNEPVPRSDFIDCNSSNDTSSSWNIGTSIITNCAIPFSYGYNIYSCPLYSSFIFSFAVSLHIIKSTLLQFVIGTNHSPLYPESITVCYPKGFLSSSSYTLPSYKSSIHFHLRLYV